MVPVLSKRRSSYSSSSEANPIDPSEARCVFVPELEPTRPSMNRRSVFNVTPRTYQGVPGSRRRTLSAAPVRSFRLAFSSTK